jgi:hypothetical protein
MNDVYLFLNSADKTEHRDIFDYMLIPACDVHICTITSMQT